MPTIPKLLRISTLFIIICTILLADRFPFLQSAEAAADSKNIDVMLVVDVSNSMETSDKNNISGEAMKMFIDMLSVKGDKLGIISYTDKVQREKALLEIKSEQDKQDLKTFIGQLDRGAYTDIAVGIDEAVKVLENSADPNHVPLIVVLADGNNFLDKKSGRTQEQSDKQLNDAIKRSQDKGYPIYTIGLNADGQLNKTALSDISKATGGKFFETSTADSLPQILSEIFASHLKLKIIPVKQVTGNGAFQDIAVSIPNSSVMEANISIMSGSPVEVKLFDPSGQQKSIPGSDVVYTKSRTYSMIKIVEPVIGDWKLQVKGVNKDKIDINLIFNYDLELVMDPPQSKTYNAGDTIPVNAYFMSEGQQVQASELYKNMKAGLVIKDVDTGQETQVEIANKGDHFEGEFKVPDKHEYEIKVNAEDQSFYRESAPVKISAKQAAAASSAGKPSPAPVKHEPEKEAKPFPLIPVVIGVIALIALLVAAYLFYSYFKKANKGFVGQLVIEIRDENTGETTYPQYKKLNMFKGKLNLHQLLQLAPELKETEKVVFTPGSNDLIVVRNLSGCALEKAGRPFDASGGKEMKSSDRISLHLQTVNKVIFVEYLV